MFVRTGRPGETGVGLEEMVGDPSETGVEDRSVRPGNSTGRVTNAGRY